MSYTDHPLPDPLPKRACQSEDLIRYGSDYPYRGDDGCCDNCGTEYSESDDSDLSNTHWMHTKKVGVAMWERDTDPRIKAFAKIMDPDDPSDAQEHAERLLSYYAEHGPILMS